MAALAADVRIGPWRLVRRLGAGGMGTVWEAAPLAGGAHVALKLMNEGPGVSRQRFFDEARLGQRVVHPNVVRVLDSGEDGERLWLAMELVSGRTFSELIRPGLEAGLVVELGRQALLGLQAVHAHVVHRDVKPSTLLLTTDGAVKLIDFGIALGGDGDRTLTRSGMLRGSLPYTSPENTRGEALDHRADLFSLGLVLHELLTGARVFDQPNEAAILTALVLNPIPPVRTRRPDVPQVLDAVVMQALERDPRARFEDADSMRLALETALPAEARWSPGDVAAWLSKHAPQPQVTKPATESISVPRATPLAPPPPRTSPARALGLLALGALCVGIIAVSVRENAPTPPPVMVAPAAELPPEPAVEVSPPDAAVILEPVAEVPKPPAPKERRVTHARAFLTVDVQPSWAHVWVDGREVGVTPAYRLALTAGRHVVELRRDDGSSRKRVVTLQADVERRLVVTW